MPKTLLSTDQIPDQLAGAPGQITAAIEGLSETQLARRPQTTDWSVAEILAHLRACADMWGDRRILAMIHEDHPIIKTMNPNTWLKQTDYPALNVAESLGLFRAQRERLLEALMPLTDEGWTRSATITGAGRPIEVTIHREGDAMGRHERSHIKQIARVISAIERIPR